MGAFAPAFAVAGMVAWLTVRLANTEAASALAALSRDSPMSVDVHPYGGFENVGTLPSALSSSDEQVGRFKLLKQLGTMKCYNLISGRMASSSFQIEGAR